MLFAVILLSANRELAVTCFSSKLLQAREASELVSTVPPVIPRLAVIVPVKAEVVVDVKLSMSGVVESADVVDGHPLLSEPTRSACLRWRFTSATAPTRIVRLTFMYSRLLRQDPPRVLVLPYGLELPVAFAPFPDTVSYVPEDFTPGEYRCEVHNTPLRRDKVEIRYGLIAFKVGYIGAQTKLFPHSERERNGGCVINDDSPKYAEVLYCARCRKAEARWSSNHRKETRYSTTGL